MQVSKFKVLIWGQNLDEYQNGFASTNHFNLQAGEKNQGKPLKLELHI